MSATIRKKRNEINKIRDDNGFWWSKGEGMEQVFVNEFKMRFTRGQNPSNDHIKLVTQIIEPCITSEQNRKLIVVPTNSEIWNAVKSIGALKAPGLDGIHASFYQECWNMVGPSMCNMVKDCFVNSTSIQLINHTNIALIPKVEFPETLIIIVR